MKNLWLILYTFSLTIFSFIYIYATKEYDLLYFDDNSWGNLNSWDKKFDDVLFSNQDQNFPDLNETVELPPGHPDVTLERAIEMTHYWREQVLDYEFMIKYHKPDTPGDFEYWKRSLQESKLAQFKWQQDVDRLRNASLEESSSQAAAENTVTGKRTGGQLDPNTSGKRAR